MGFRYRKSVKLAPGVRMTLSKSGVGYSVGRKGYRITKRADGRVQQTVSLPGTGLSYTSTTSSRRRSSTSRPRPSVQREAIRRALATAPMPRGTKRTRLLIFIGFALTVVGFVVLPLLLLALPCLLVGLVLSLVNVRRDMRWYREYKAARTQALADLLSR